MNHVVFWGVEISIIGFSILLLEYIFLCIAFIYYLSRPADNSRLLYLLLLVFLIFYNTCTIFFPSESLPINYNLQVVLAYFGGIPLSMFFTYYLFRVYQLTKLKFYATYGPILFIFLPFVLFFLLPYLTTGDVELARKLLVMVPSIYILVFIFRLAIAFKYKYRETEDSEKFRMRRTIIATYLAILFWISLPLWTVLGPTYQDIELLMTNIGFIIFTFLYIFNKICSAKQEYIRLIESEAKLKELNSGLSLKVREKTKHLVELNEVITNNFINISHEIKTPLTLIRNYIDDLDDQVKVVNEFMLIKSNLDKIIDDINNFFITEKFKRKVNVYDHNEIIDASYVLNSIIDLYKLSGRKIQADLDGPVLLNIDREALIRLFRNPIDNAVKYSDGDIEVSLKRLGNKVRYQVKDYGPGITNIQKKRIFEPYYQGKVNNQSQGIGIGLYIVKQIVDSLNGSIKVNSNMGAGFNIIIELDIADSIADNSRNNPKVRSRNHFEFERNIDDVLIDSDYPTILLVEDNLELLHYYKRKLSNKYNMVLAKNAIEALNKLKGNKIDLISSDIMMEKMDGFKLLEIIRKKPQYNNIPFLFVSARSSHQDFRRSLKLKAVDYIKKPFLISDFVNKIEALLMISMSRNGFGASYVNSNGELSELGFVNEKFVGLELSRREMEIIDLLFKGLPNKLIAAELHISENTVAKHLSNIYAKCDVSGRSHLITKFS